MMTIRNRFWWMCIACGVVMATHMMKAQEGARKLTADDYARAEVALPWNVKTLVRNLHLTPHWIDQSDRFWYKSEIPSGWEFLAVDPQRGLKEPAFDHKRLAIGLSLAAHVSYTSTRLPFETFEFIESGRRIEFNADQKIWSCDLATYDCKSNGIALGVLSTAQSLSPNKQWIAFVKDHNLYVRSAGTNQEIQLTTDGKQYDDYGTSPEVDQQGVTEQIRRVYPVGVIWSPDSRKLLSYQLDQTKVRDSYLLQAVPPGPIGAARPVLYSYRYALPGDSNVAMAEYYVFDLTKKSRVALQIPEQEFTFTPDVQLKSIWWSSGGDAIYCVQRDRWSKTLKFSTSDAVTGATRIMVEEHAKTMIETIPQQGDGPLVPLLSGSNEVLWYSERDGWGHFYLYDANTGKLKTQVTSGQWVVREVKYIDEGKGSLYFTASGREKGRNPYARYLYRIRLDGTGLQLLTPEDGDHEITFAPDGRYFIDTYSRIDTVPISKVRSSSDGSGQELEHGNIQKLVAQGFRFPEPFHAKAADGTTDIYGAIFRPSKFDARKHYPIVDSIYPGPQMTQTPENFAGALGGAEQARAIAELGFVVITVDGRGTPLRSKPFHDYSYGNLGDAGGLEDHVAAIKQLALRYPYLDLKRVGIYGHSGGGYATVRAMLTYPDFYRVGFASAGEQDMRGYLAYWGETYQGPISADNYLESSNPNLALRAKLKGKLLIAWGDMDDNVPPSLQLQLIHSLVTTNQDFDMLVLPNRNHSYFVDPYLIRRLWDYLVVNLLGAKPPNGYQIKNGPPYYRSLDAP